MDEQQSELLKLVPPRWLKAEQLAFGIALLKSIEAPTQDQIALVLEHYLPEDIESLPPATLEAIVDLGPDNVGARITEYPKWQQTLERLKNEKGKSLTAGAKLIANRIMSGKLRSAQLMRLAHSELNCRWENHGLADHLDELVASLSQDRTSTRQRLEALARFPVSDQPKRWSLVENALLQQSLYWPLLVFEQNDEAASALSVPVAIDVELRQHADQNDFGKVNWYRAGLIECSAWHAVGEEALRTAKELWLHRHGSWDFGFQRSVKRASAHIDLHIAEAVIEPFRVTEARDDSHGLYLALAFLAEFLDERAAMETTCATGSLGRRRPDPEAKDRGDRSIEMPGGVPLKIEWAAKARIFDKIVVPRLPDNFQEWLPEGFRQVGGHLRICQCVAEEVREADNMFSQAAGHVFGQNWRRHRYVRCPDLADAFREERERKDKEPDAEVRQLLNDLKSSPSPVFVANSAVNPKTVARVLYRVNDAARLDRSSRLEGYKKISSFAFIRVVDEEINERFWQVVWDVLNGSDESFFSFRFDVSRTIPGLRLADELNKFRPKVGERCRSPDILVIVGSNRICSSVSTRISHGPFSRLRLEPIVDALRQGRRLRSSQIETLKNIVGDTRIILVSEEEGHENEANPIGTERQEVRAAAQQLSIFRYGFKYQMARHLLGERTDEVLRELMQTNGTGRPLLRYSNRAGDYYFPTPLQESSNLIETAELHFKAADAIIGFLASDKDRRNGATSAARFDYREAFSPAPLHEAQYHLRESWSRIGTLLGKEAYKHPVFQKARNAQERLSRMGEMFGWTHVRWATQALRQDSKDLLEALKDHLAAIDVRGVHPIELVWAAKFVFKLARDHERRSPAESIKLANYDLCWRSLLDWAWLNCTQFDGGEEGAACRFVIATERACKSLSQKRNGDGLRQAMEHIEAASNLKSFASEILDLEWFEFLGDSLDDPAAAARSYRDGIWNDEIAGAHRIRYQTLIKYLGACVQAKLRDGLRGQALFNGEIIDRIKELPRDMLERIRSATLDDGDPQNRSGLSDPSDTTLAYVRERWRIGGNVFRCELGLFPQPPTPARPIRRDHAVKVAKVRLRSDQTGTAHEPTGQVG